MTAPVTAVVVHGRSDGAARLLWVGVAQEPWRGCVALPMGRVRTGDPDGAAAACRILREQVGIEATPGQLVHLGERAVPGDLPGPRRIEVVGLRWGGRPPARPGIEWLEVEAARRRWARGTACLAPPLDAALRWLCADRALGPSCLVDDHAWVEPIAGIRVLPLRTDTLPPATHTNAYLVGEGEVLFVEPATADGAELARVERAVERLRAGGERVVACLVTHHHPDHAGGARALPERLGVPLWAHAETAARLPRDTHVARELEDGERIHLGPLTLEVLHTPGHAPGHLCLRDERSGALIAGDMVAGVGTVLVDPDDGDMAQYLDSLERLRRAVPSVLLPAHGGPIREAQQKLSHYVSHRLAREAKVLAALVQHGASARAEDLVPQAYDDVPAQVWGLAARSVRAHLAKLEQEGRVRRRGDGWEPAPT